MGKNKCGRDSSRLDERHKRHKRRDEDEKKTTKKRKSHSGKDRKSHRRHKRSHHSDSDTPCPDYKRARKVVRELLMETPELTKDLVQLLQMLDDGEVAVIGGIENQHIRSKLKELFPLLGLYKLREPKDAFAKPHKGKANAAESLVDVFKKMLSGDTKESSSQRESELRRAEFLATSVFEGNDETLSSEGAAPVRKRELPIGPALPGSDAQNDDDEVVGPALPGMKGFRLADERVEAEMALKAEQLEKEQWKRALDSGESLMAKVDKKSPLVREAWMTMMPESSILKDSLGPQNRPPGKPAAFRSKEPAAVDKTWFDSPEERERAKRAKLDMELLGYVREENAPSGAVASSMTSTIAPKTVNESILPSVNPEADEAMWKQMENLRKARGPSLLEQHQRTQAEHAKDAVSSMRNGGWNRNRDLTARRGMSGDDAERMITAAKQINSKFTAPTISRQFL